LAPGWPGPGAKGRESKRLLRLASARISIAHGRFSMGPIEMADSATANYMEIRGLVGDWIVSRAVV